jgi:23S rRNA (cytidine1920-2'-O)/16S rRNA (cytidine1409-2'-O)-methyltransferase
MIAYCITRFCLPHRSRFGSGLFTMTRRIRADRLLVDRGLFASRARAQAAIAAGLVTADALPVRKASDQLPIGAELHAVEAHPYVSRGGIKLAHALDFFGFDPAGIVCLDVGAGAGGFTDVLLARGAARVYALDVGRGQIHPRLRARPEVVSLEQTDIRLLDPLLVPDRPRALAIDVSFISLRLALPPALALMGNPAWMVALIKPQFEAGRAHVKKGIVRNAEVHHAVCDDIAALVAAQGWTVTGLTPSPILGGDGNAEILIGARRD